MLVRAKLVPLGVEIRDLGLILHKLQQKRKQAHNTSTARKAALFHTSAKFKLV